MQAISLKYYLLFKLSVFLIPIRFGFFSSLNENENKNEQVLSVKPLGVYIQYDRLGEF